MRLVQRGLAVLMGLSVLAAAAGTSAQAVVGAAQGFPAPREEPYLVWFIRSLGLYGLLSLASGLAVFVGACAVVALARRPAVIASYLVFLLLPLLFAVTGAVQGTVSSFAVIARSDVVLKQSEIFAGIAEALVVVLSALTITLPSYFVVAIGLFVRTLQSPKGSGRVQ